SDLPPVLVVQQIPEIQVEPQADDPHPDSGILHHVAGLQSVDLVGRRPGVERLPAAPQGVGPLGPGPEVSRRHVILLKMGCQRPAAGSAGAGRPGPPRSVTKARAHGARLAPSVPVSSQSANVARCQPGSGSVKNSTRGLISGSQSRILNRIASSWVPAWMTRSPALHNDASISM